MGMNPKKKVTPFTFDPFSLQTNFLVVSTYLCTLRAKKASIFASSCLPMMVASCGLEKRKLCTMSHRSSFIRKKFFFCFHSLRNYLQVELAAQMKIGRD